MAQSAFRPEVSLRSKGALIGGLYALTLTLGIISQMLISDKLVDLGDAARTAANIAGNRTLYRTSFTLYMIELLSQITFTLMLYDLLKPVSKSVARTAAIIGVIGCGIKIIARLFYYAPLFVLPDAGASSVYSGFTHEQLQSLTLVLLKLNDYCAAIAMVFFGFESMLDGWLIMKSRFLPRFLGGFAMAGGIGWMTFIWPPLGYQLFMLIAPIALIGSLLKIGWLIARGVDQQKWHEQSRLAAESIWR